MAAFETQDLPNNNTAGFEGLTITSSSVKKAGSDENKR